MINFVTHRIFQHVLDLETPLLINNPSAKHWSFVPKDSEINRLIQKGEKAQNRELELYQ